MYTQRNSGKVRSTSSAEENAVNQALVYLSEVALEVPSVAELPRSTVPPTTPESTFHFELKFLPIPRTDRNLSELQIPIVRNKGLKRCIDEMSEFFGCSDYKFNFLQYWFLDVLTDCIWRAQDQYEFPAEQQRIILAWVIFVIDVIGDPHQNYSQQEFFNMFKEAILTAAAVMEEGNGEVLLPLKLIKLPSEASLVAEKSKTSTDASASTTATTVPTSTSEEQHSTSNSADTMDYNSVLEFELGNETHQLVLDHEKCNCSEFGESLPSTMERLLEEQPPCDSDKPLYDDEQEEEVDDTWDIKDFYKPDTKVPSRFLPLTVSEQLTGLLKKEEESLKDIGPTSKLTFLPIAKSDSKSDRSSDKLTDYVIFRKESWQKSEDLGCWEDQSDVAEETKDETATLENQESKTESENTQHEKIMKGLRKFKLMEQRVRDFSDSKVGLDEWQMETTDSTPNNKSKISEVEYEGKAKCFVDKELQHLVDTETLNSLDEREFLSFGVLWAIIDFVYEYFSDSFQYTLIKMALTIQTNMILQNLNDEWRAPKNLSEDLTLSVKDIKDKYKLIQRKEEKKGKQKDKKDKKGKGKDKGKDKKKGKDDKKSKKTDKKSDKADKKKGKGKEKKPQLTEEELLLQRQLEEEEAERLRQEMNKRFLFPLQDAINDAFFKSKFPNWEKVEVKPEKKGKNKAKKKK